jgi:glutamate racemase
MGSGVRLINSADATVSVVRDVLAENNISRSVGSGAQSSSRHSGLHEFYSSGDVQQFAEFGRRFLGPELSVAKQWPK